MQIDTVGKDRTSTVSALLARGRPVELFRRHEPWLSMVPAGMERSADAWYDRIPAGHPLVLLRAHVDARLASMSGAVAPLEQIVSDGLSPQMLLRACILKSFSLTGGDQYFRDLLTFNTLYRWFVAIPAGQQPVESVMRSLLRLGQNPALLAATTQLMANLLGDAPDLVRRFTYCGR